MDKHGQLEHITVAVDFSEYTRLLVAIAENLALQSGASLQLVYVVEPWDQHGLARLLAQDDRVVNMVQSADAYSYDRMEKLMVDLANEINPKISVVPTLRQGNAPDVIIAAALEYGSDLIVAGVQGDMPHLYPKNLSTALALMTDSPLPIMAVPHNAVLRRDRHEIKLLICDDLTQNSAFAIHSAFEFAQELKNSEVFHLHVTQLNPQMLDAAIEQVTVKSQGTIDPGLDGNTVFALAERALQDRLRERVPENMHFQKGYFPLLREGSLEMFITQIIHDQNIDLLLFGQHQSIHFDPLYVGHMPFTSMVNHHIPVVIFPREEVTRRWRKEARKAIENIDRTETAL